MSCTATMITVQLLLSGSLFSGHPLLILMDACQTPKTPLIYFKFDLYEPVTSI